MSDINLFEQEVADIPIISYSAKDNNRTNKITTSTLQNYLEQLLCPLLFIDKSNNGLQIEGVEEISKIAFAVTADAISIAKAVALKVDALIVHHGIFIKSGAQGAVVSGAAEGEPFTLTGINYRKRILPLLKNNINLFAYHLPLDAHMEIGHAATLAKMLDMQEIAPFSEEKGTGTNKMVTIGAKGRFKNKISAIELKNTLSEILNHPVIVSGPHPHTDTNKKIIESAGIVTGRASVCWRNAYNEKLDALITGEVTEGDWSLVREHGMHLFAAGHTATEELGLHSLVKKIQTAFTVDCVVIKSTNPV